MPDNITVYGFWVNDPYPASLGGLGENSYKTLATWVSDYYHPLTTDDVYDGKYVAIFEPPEINENAELVIAQSPGRFSPEQRRILSQIETQDSRIPPTLMSESDQVIIQAAVDGVMEELIPYDHEFAASFQKTAAGKPLFIRSDIGDSYYAIPFNLPMKRSKTLMSDPTSSLDKTIIVVLIDAGDGRFKEASWVKQAVKYLPLSKDDVREILPEILEEIGIDPQEPGPIQLQLTHYDSTPYYPDWKVTLKKYGIELYIKQDGTLRQ
jgi:hypothetical protein